MLHRVHQIVSGGTKSKELQAVKPKQWTERHYNLTSLWKTAESLGLSLLSHVFVSSDQWGQQVPNLVQDSVGALQPLNGPYVSLMGICTTVKICLLKVLIFAIYRPRLVLSVWLQRNETSSVHLSNQLSLNKKFWNLERGQVTCRRVNIWNASIVMYQPGRVCSSTERVA